MKKFSLSIAFALFASAIAFSPVNAQQDEAQATFERTWYATCYTEKNVEKCYQQSKELLAKYPNSTYAKNARGKVDSYEQSKALDSVNEKFQAALKAYYAGPDANKLDQLFVAGDEFLKVVPGNQYVIGQVALAGAHGSMGQIYKNFDKVKGYGEEALRVFEPTTAPEGWPRADWDNLRELITAQVNQFLGYRLIETKGDKAQAVAYLTKATEVKNKDGAGWKDPNNYWLRASIALEEYQALRAEYDKLTDEQKTGEPGKELLKKVNEVIDNKLIPDYARVIAAATKPEAKSLKDAAQPSFDAYWKYRTNAPEKAADYLKTFNADPTVASPAIPVKAEDSATGSLEAPAGTAQKPTMVVGGGPGSAPGAASKSATNGAKPASTKKAAPAKGRKGRRP